MRILLAAHACSRPDPNHIFPLLKLWYVSNVTLWLPPLGWISVSNISISVIFFFCTSANPHGMHCFAFALHNVNERPAFRFIQIFCCFLNWISSDISLLLKWIDSDMPLQCQNPSISVIIGLTLLLELYFTLDRKHDQDCTETSFWNATDYVFCPIILALCTKSETIDGAQVITVHYYTFILSGELQH